MKRKLPIFSIATVLIAIAVFMVSCGSKEKAESQTQLLPTVDTTGLADFQAWKAVNERKDASMYMNASQNQPVAAVPAPRKTTTARKATTQATQPVAVAEPAKKKGWSKAAKGAAIGTAGGAIAGAIINKKNRVLGGVIGGVIGGGVGYGIGRGQDKKDGRY
jgi:hypothetical protein